ncbi:hypothetical protein ZWY2020_028538 [Hordeum vulgare]|nr:hypothetical protein ZWY2020_028538 [Hordeum vulgare]
MDSTSLAAPTHLPSLLRRRLGSRLGSVHEEGTGRGGGGGNSGLPDLRRRRSDGWARSLAAPRAIVDLRGEEDSRTVVAASGTPRRRLPPERDCLTAVVASRAPRCCVSCRHHVPEA